METTVPVNHDTALKALAAIKFLLRCDDLLSKTNVERLAFMASKVQRRINKGEFPNANVPFSNPTER
jgi:hypothetical protein